MKKLLSIFWTLLVVSILSAADTLVFMLEDEPIYTTNNEEKPGFLLELVTEIVQKLELPYRVEFLPWKRAQMMTRNTPNALIFPFTRTETREKDYQWVCKVFDVPVMFINKAGMPVINSVEEAEKLDKFAVIFGTPQEEQVIEWGLTRHAHVEGKQLFRVLQQDQVQAIYTARPEAVYGWKAAGYTEKLQFGATLQVLPLWIATSKQSTTIDSEAWEKALEELRKDGTFDRIFAEYFGD